MRRLWPWIRRGSVWTVACLTLVVLGSVGWSKTVSAGYLHDAASAPEAETVVVFGTLVAPNRTDPSPILRSRLDTAVKLVRAGKALRVIVTGDGNGESGNEPEVMTRYLIGQGIAPELITADLDGIDTYESCVRLREVYKVSRALLVTQDYHLYRAVAICRSAGIDAEGAVAGCDDCPTLRVLWGHLRGWLATPKAVAEVYLS
jgi:vancomycin permeability regulator SanA